MANRVCLGTEIKLNVRIEPMGDMTADKYDFSVNLYCSPSKIIKVTKNEARRLDESNYIVTLDTGRVGIGRLKCKVVAEIPDGDFADNKRTEINVMDTGIEVVKNI